VKLEGHVVFIDLLEYDLYEVGKILGNLLTNAG
jgi:hypothetical protein